MLINLILTTTATSVLRNTKPIHFIYKFIIRHFCNCTLKKILHSAYRRNKCLFTTYFSETCIESAFSINNCFRLLIFRRSYEPAEGWWGGGRARRGRVLTRWLSQIGGAGRQLCVQALSGVSSGGKQSCVGRHDRADAPFGVDLL